MCPPSADAAVADLADKVKDVSIKKPVSVFVYLFSLRSMWTNDKVSFIYFRLINSLTFNFFNLYRRAMLKLPKPLFLTNAQVFR